MRGKISTLLFLLLLVAVPALVVIGFWLSPVSIGTVSGPQPGGAIEGRVVDPTGAAASHAAIESYRMKRSGSMVEMSLEHETKADAEGRFSFELPPIEHGYYLVRAGGGAWRWSSQEISLVDNAGRTRTIEPLELEVEPAARLRVRFERADGGPIAPGRYELTYTFGIFSTSKGMRSGAVHDGVLELDGLDPLKGDLEVEFDTGEKITMPLELGEGLTERKVRL